MLQVVRATIVAIVTGYNSNQWLQYANFQCEKANAPLYKCRPFNAEMGHIHRRRMHKIENRFLTLFCHSKWEFRATKIYTRDYLNKSNMQYQPI